MRPRSFREGFLALPAFYRPPDPGRAVGVVDFRVTGEEPGRWHLVLDGARCTVAEGAAEGEARLAITTPSQVWLRIMRGELNGAEAFLSGQVTAVGDAELLFALRSFFRFQPGRGG